MHNKNMARERQKSIIETLHTLSPSQTSRGRMAVYFRHRQVYLISIEMLPRHKHLIKDIKSIKRLPSTFFAYVDESGEFQICGNSPNNAKDIKPVFNYLDAGHQSGTVFNINYHDLKKPISLSDCKGKAFLEDNDKWHFDCFKTHAGSKLNVFPNDPPAYNVRAQESEESNPNSRADQVEDEADGFSSIVPSSCSTEFPPSSLDHRPSHLSLHSIVHNNSSFEYDYCNDLPEWNRQHGENTRVSEIVANEVLLQNRINRQLQQDDVSTHLNSFRLTTSVVQNREQNYLTAKYPDFRNEEVRRKSFDNWPRTLPDAREFVPRGFFYTGIGDLVRCFCCGIGLKDFSDGDNPLMEHVKHSRNCAFLVECFGSREELHRYAQTISTREPEDIRRQQRQQYNSLQGRNVIGYRARHESLRSLQARLDTFTNWPLHLTQRPYQLADAGLYYTGTDDHCRCFACDGGLRKWEPGDDPWIEHCRWFPACPYAFETKGRDFIDLIQLSADQAAEENASAPQEDMTNAFHAMSMQDPLVQGIVDRHDSMLKESMGFSDEIIKQAVLELVQQGMLIQ
ncbi:uncharacterized protein LOC127849738 [Dreissena polymorpha]|uniref:uncharacterized protein LOC127849738 n=1 Tax=Dreissena polymorpha TaxID=45954 RepID=UPI0022651E1E|nr:uncharacterized protein LOC127849738 [Dreissena polymorpha]